MTSRTVIKCFLWLMALATLIAIAVNALEMTKSNPAPLSGGTVTFQVSQAGDGSLHIVLSDLEVDPVVAMVVLSRDNTIGPWFGELPCWGRQEWSLDVQPKVISLTQSQRAGIARLAFAFCRERVPTEALTAVPPPGSTVVSGVSETRDWARCAQYVLLSGRSVFFAIMCGIAGVVLLATPAPKRRDPSICPGCRYSRAGLAADAPCPECGRMG